MKLQYAIIKLVYRRDFPDRLYIRNRTEQKILSYQNIIHVFINEGEEDTIL